MNLTADNTLFLQKLDQFEPGQYVSERTLALFSAAITFDDNEITQKAIQTSLEFSLTRDDLYEIILQSYLFLGFPRMLQAADVLQDILPSNNNTLTLSEFDEKESLKWYDNGIKLCKQVYRHTYEPLKNKVVSMAPEIFQWMVFEGYGKVLSRNQLPIVTRELSIIAFLMMENRTRQLRSHLHGALNVGAAPEQIQLVVDDIGDAAGIGYETALQLMQNIGIKQ